MTELSARLLAERPAGLPVALPPYSRDGLRPGIVHIGVGIFHRAHQAAAIDALLARGEARDYAICGVGVLPADAAMRDALTAQDFLYTLEERHPDGERRARVIGSLIDYVFAPDDPRAAVARLASPTTRIVSLTITEGGYNVDPATGGFRADAPAIHADLADPSRPATVFGLVVEALRLRRDQGVTPFSVLSCDNIQGNGNLTRRVIVEFARLRDAELAAWIDRSVSFPNTMVDRITPVTTPGDRAHARDELGLDDAIPVACEPFFQWVVEDDFTAGRPPLELAGAQFVADVEPYEAMKLRLLNASHQVMAHLGHLAGHRFVHDAVADPAVKRLVTAYLREATPTVPEVPGIDVHEYQVQLLQRFSNPSIADTVARLCAETSDRIPTFLLPVARMNVAAGRPAPICAAALALWARYARGIDEQGVPIDVVDRRASELTTVAEAESADPGVFLRLVAPDLARDAGFAAAYERATALIAGVGVRRAALALAASP